MNDDRSKQDVSANQDAGKEQCGPGCGCEKPGLNTRMKTVICLVIAIAAVIVLMRGFDSKTANTATKGKAAFAVTSAVAPATTENIDKTETDKSEPLLWGKPLKDIASLNELAAQKDAVFLYLVKKGQQPNESIKNNIENAVTKNGSRGVKMAFYILDTNSPDYAQVTSQSPAPCVLALVKGVGMATVSGDISEKKLLEAIVSASRASSCGPSGCGPSSSGCN